MNVRMALVNMLLRILENEPPRDNFWLVFGARVVGAVAISRELLEKTGNMLNGDRTKLGRWKPNLREA